MNTNSTQIAEILLTVERLNEVTQMSLDIQKILDSKYMKLTEETRTLLTNRLAELEEEIDQINFRLDTMKNEETTNTTFFDEFEYDTERRQDTTITISLKNVNESELWTIYDLFNKLTRQYEWFEYRTVINEDEYSKDFPYDTYECVTSQYNKNIPEGYDDEEPDEETDCE